MGQGNIGMLLLGNYCKCDYYNVFKHGRSTLIRHIELIVLASPSIHSNVQESISSNWSHIQEKGRSKQFNLGCNSAIYKVRFCS